MFDVKYPALAQLPISTSSSSPGLLPGRDGGFPGLLRFFFNVFYDFFAGQNVIQFPNLSKLILRYTIKLCNRSV
ncbi:MAG: hypothetical protein QXT26_08050 [Thermoproteota archaeon]